MIILSQTQTVLTGKLNNHFIINEIKNNNRKKNRNIKWIIEQTNKNFYLKLERRALLMLVMDTEIYKVNWKRKSEYFVYDLTIQVSKEYKNRKD